MKPTNVLVFVDSMVASCLTVSHRKDKTLEQFKDEWGKAIAEDGSADVATIALRKEGWEIMPVPIDPDTFVEAPKLYQGDE
jgi:hypothetical protein